MVEMWKKLFPVVELGGFQSFAYGATDYLVGNLDCKE